MQKVSRLVRLDYPIFITAGFLILIGVSVLRSIAGFLFPVYFLYIFLGVIAFFLFIQIDFDVFVLFAKHLYIASIIFLLLPLLIGQVTRGAIRWVPLGPLTIQPSEIVRPFLLIFFAKFLTEEDLDLARFLKALLLLVAPVVLILIQPSLGVAILTMVAFLGVFLASNIKKKYLLVGMGVFLVLLPVLWSALKPYQKQRIISFLNPTQDPYGAGYNSIQSMISVGSGKLTGRGLGKGVQAQLAFLPERHTDFIFAATAEELGFIGAALLLFGLFLILWRLTKIMEKATSPAARAYVSGLFLALFAQTIIHVGMNVGLLPITGIPLPLVSAGGSSLMSTLISLAIAINTKKAF